MGKKSADKKYTADEIRFIPNYDNNSVYINIAEYTDENGLVYKVLTEESFEYSEDNKEFLEDNAGFQVLDNNLKVVVQAGKMEYVKQQYTEEELNFMEGIYNNEYCIQKYQYFNNLGQKRTAVIKYNNIENENFYKSINIFSSVSVGVFSAAYIICIILLVILLRRKFYEPLEKLNWAMSELAEGDAKEPIKYAGPKEFVDICDNFNIMVSKLKSSEEEKAHLMKEKERMMADISHDLKTPITSIQGYAKALVDDVIPATEQKKYMNIIYNKSRRLTELINLFHDYSKLEHPNFSLQLENTDLCEYIRAYIALKYEDIIENDFNIQIDIPEEEMYTKIDRVQFQRVLDNLLVNSIKHNPKETTIFVSLSKNENGYEIIIADNGVGIPKEIANNIFDPFTIGDESRNISHGSGLGLAIAKTIVDLHKGNIELITNEKEYKTIFKITLLFNKNI